MVTRLFSYAFREFQSKISSLPNRLHRNPLILLKENPKKIMIASLGYTIYVLNSETVPYTNRRRLIVFSSELEKRYGDQWFEKRKLDKFDGEILPPSHPDNVRVQKIAKDIIDATRRELRKDRHRRAQTAHVEEFNWEVVVVDEPTKNNAYCAYGGKIIVKSGLLRASKSDDEIARVIGHEVGHHVARHPVEKASRSLLASLSKPLFILPVLARYRRCEREADYIGLLLSASAGYDPRAALQKMKRLAAETKNELEFSEYINSTHPPYEERARLLSNPKVMEEALSMYREALSHRICKNN